jgi:hypothetical protein
VRLFPVTVDDSIDAVAVESRIRIIRVYWGRGDAVYYVPYFLPFSNFVLFFHFPFLMSLNFYIIKKSQFKNFSRPTCLGNAALYTKRCQPTKQR